MIHAFRLNGVDVRWELLSFGTAALHVGTKRS